MKRYIQKLNRIWKLILLFILLGMTFSYAMFQGGFVSWFLFYSFLPFAIYGLLVAIYPIRDWEVNRKMEKHEYSAKEELVVEIELSRKTFFPIFYLLIEDCFSFSGSNKLMGKTILMPGFKRHLSYTYKIDELPRGEHTFSQLLLKVGDPLGLIETEKVYKQEDKILVYPPYENIVYKPLETHYEQGLASSKERVQRDTTMAVGIREYQPGDRFSWINWKASAKRNNMMTKEFEQRQSQDLLVVMDSMESEGFEVLVSFTASMVRAILKKGAQTGFLSVDEKERVIFPIRGGESHQQLILHYLARVRPVKGLTIAQMLDTENSLFQQHTTLLLVTTELTETLIERVSYLSSKQFNIGVFVVKKERDSLSADEKTWSLFASKRGIRIIPVTSGKFNDVFSRGSAG